MNPPVRHALVVFTSVALLFNVGGCVAPVEHSQSTAVVGGNAATPASQGIDARYTADGLRLAFAALCQQLGYRALRVEIDQSEFPFLVHGVLHGPCDYREIRDGVNTMRGYAYTGSVTNVLHQGAVTVFALNMIPSSEYVSDGNPNGLMQRLKTLASSQR